MTTENPPPGPAPEAPNRMERMVGQMIGLRMLVTKLLADEGARRGDPDAYLAETRAATLAALESWPVGSDTPEGAERIKRCTQAMLREFPKPMPVDV